MVRAQAQAQAGAGARMAQGGVGRLIAGLAPLDWDCKSTMPLHIGPCGSACLGDLEDTGWE